MDRPNKNQNYLEPMKCDEVDQLEEDYLNGSLAGKPEEERLVRHLQSCAGCRNRLGADQELLGRLFASFEAVPPPPYIKTSLLLKVNNLPQNANPGQLQPVSAQPVPAQAFEKPEKAKPDRWRIWFGRAALVPAGLATLVIGLSLWVFMLNTELANTREQQTQYQQLLAMTTAPDSIMWEMRPGQASDSNRALARMYVQPGASFYLVTGTNFKPAPAGQVYKFWYIQSGQVQAGSSLLPDARGQIISKINRSNRSPVRAEITACFITLEKLNDPANQPANPPLLRWTKGAD